MEGLKHTMNEHQKKDSGADKKIKRLARKPPGFIRQEKSRPLACFFALIARLTLGPLRAATRLLQTRFLTFLRARITRHVPKFFQYFTIGWIELYQGASNT